MDIRESRTSVIHAQFTNIVAEQMSLLTTSNARSASDSPSFGMSRTATGQIPDALPNNHESEFLHSTESFVVAADQSFSDSSTLCGDVAPIPIQISAPRATQALEGARTWNSGSPIGLHDGSFAGQASMLNKGTDLTGAYPLQGHTFELGVRGGKVQKLYY